MCNGTVTSPVMEKAEYKQQMERITNFVSPSLNWEKNPCQLES